MCVFVPQRSKKASNIPNAKGDYPMKANHLLTICECRGPVFERGQRFRQNDNGAVVVAALAAARQL